MMPNKSTSQKIEESQTIEELVVWRKKINADREKLENASSRRSQIKRVYTISSIQRENSKWKRLSNLDKIIDKRLREIKQQS